MTNAMCILCPLSTLIYPMYLFLFQSPVRRCNQIAQIRKEFFRSWSLLAFSFMFSLATVIPLLWNTLHYLLFLSVWQIAHGQFVKCVTAKRKDRLNMAICEVIKQHSVAQALTLDFLSCDCSVVQAGDRYIISMLLTPAGPSPLSSESLVRPDQCLEDFCIHDQ